MQILNDVARMDRRDSEGALDAALLQHEQATLHYTVNNSLDEHEDFDRVIIVGMGGSALAAQFVQTWLADKVTVPIELVRSYDLPPHVHERTLVITSSCSGNTEETLTAYSQARQKKLHIAVVAKGGELLKRAKVDGTPYCTVPDLKMQPRLLTIAQLKALSALLIAHHLISTSIGAELDDACVWIGKQAQAWGKEVPTDDNLAKQLAGTSVGKTAIFYAGPVMAAAAYKWKISWNESAKNLAFYGLYPEFNHNEFMGWSSHPVEKPFIVFDFRSPLERPRVIQRLELSDKLLSGLRPKAHIITPEGDTVLKQLLWANVLGDLTSIYLGILNNVDPGPVPLIEKFKKELG